LEIDVSLIAEALWSRNLPDNTEQLA
jgi:hypothetical protein